MSHGAVKVSPGTAGASKIEPVSHINPHHLFAGGQRLEHLQVKPGARFYHQGWSHSRLREWRANHDVACTSLRGCAHWEMVFPNGLS